MKEFDAGYYGLGGGLFVEKSNAVKYETPSKYKLTLLEQQSHPESAGKVYPDGWAAPVLKSAWSQNQATNFETLQNELGFTGDGHFFDIQEKPQAIVVNGGSEGNEVTIKFYMWNAPSMEQGYRIPVVAKELFKLYFGNDATLYGETLKWKEYEFVEAANASGAKSMRILTRYIIPQIIPSIIVSGTLTIAAAILTESAISYLGLGIQPPTPTWGNMLQNSQQYIWTAPVLGILPGAAITIAVLAYNFLGAGFH